MRIRFVCETRANGTTLWFTTKQDEVLGTWNYVGDSARIVEKEGRAIFEDIKSNAVRASLTVIEEVEV